MVRDPAAGYNNSVVPENTKHREMSNIM